jgi:rRNA maturation protein Nop10
MIITGLTLRFPARRFPAEYSRRCPRWYQMFTLLLAQADKGALCGGSPRPFSPRDRYVRKQDSLELGACGGLLRSSRRFRWC